MALTPLSVPQFPNVPQAAGVPPLPRSPSFPVQNTVVSLVSDAIGILQLFEGPQWGIFDQVGNPAIIGDSVFAVDYRREFRIADFPVVQGGFASYNKIALPFDIRVSFISSGNTSFLGSLIPGGAAISLITGSDPSGSARSTFLQSLDQAIQSLYLFTVVTPDAVYPSVNIVHYDYHREARNGGVSMIRVDVWCQEVRVAATTQFANGEPTGTDSTDPAMQDQNQADPGPGSGGDTGAGSGNPPNATGGNSVPKVGGNTATPQGKAPVQTGSVEAAPAGGANAIDVSGGKSTIGQGSTGGSGGLGSGTGSTTKYWSPGFSTDGPPDGAVTKGYEYLIPPGATVQK